MPLTRRRFFRIFLRSPAMLLCLTVLQLSQGSFKVSALQAPLNASIAAVPQQIILPSTSYHTEDLRRNRMKHFSIHRLFQRGQ